MSKARDRLYLCLLGRELRPYVREMFDKLREKELQLIQQQEKTRRAEKMMIGLIILSFYSLGNALILDDCDDDRNA